LFLLPDSEREQFCSRCPSREMEPLIQYVQNMLNILKIRETAGHIDVNMLSLDDWAILAFLERERAEIWGESQ